MERRMEAKHWRVWVNDHSDGKWDANRPLPTNEQLYTRSCVHCAGLLMSEWYYGLSSTGEHSIEIFRCVQCGHRVNLAILQNQTLVSIESQPMRQLRPRYSTRTAILSKPA